MTKNLRLQYVTWDRPLPLPIDVTREHYQKKSLIPFDLELLDYMRNGIVISLPTAFGMGRIINLAKEGQPLRLAFFVRWAAGNLADLVLAIPTDLKEIAFCRREDGKMRIWPLKRLVQLGKRKRKETANNG